MKRALEAQKQRRPIGGCLPKFCESYWFRRIESRAEICRSEIDRAKMSSTEASGAGPPSHSWLLLGVLFTPFLMKCGSWIVAWSTQRSNPSTRKEEVSTAGRELLLYCCSCWYLSLPFSALPTQYQPISSPQVMIPKSHLRLQRCIQYHHQRQFGSISRWDCETNDVGRKKTRTRRGGTTYIVVIFIYVNI